jgi:hypothetical protein
MAFSSAYTTAVAVRRDMRLERCGQYAAGLAEGCDGEASVDEAAPASRGRSVCGCDCGA